VPAVHGEAADSPSCDTGKNKGTFFNLSAWRRRRRRRRRRRSPLDEETQTPNDRPTMPRMKRATL